MTLVEQFPFRVRVPLKGSFHLLEWNTEGDGSHVIIARTQESLCKTFFTVLKNHCDAEVKCYYQADFVSPSELMEELYARREEDLERLNFRWKFSNPLKYYMERRKLPAKISKCKKAVDEDGKVIKPEYQGDNAHRHCVNCVDGFLVEGYTTESLYEKLKDKVFKKDRDERAKRGRVSTAPRPVAKQSLYLVTSDPGHHHRGTAVDEFSGWESIAAGDFYLDNVHFFFQGKKCPTPSAISNAIKTERDSWKEADKRSKEEHKLDNQRHLDKLYAEVEDLVKDL